MAAVRTCWQWLRQWLRLALSLVGLAMPLPGAEPSALRLVPVYAQVEVATGARAELTVSLQTATALTILAVTADCGCITPLDAFPRAAAPGVTALHLRATGILPGIKTVTVRTTAGTATAQIQVVTPGFGQGRQLLAELQQAGQALVIIHDLQGETRNCGCSGGALGGIDHLAALPAALPRARWVLTGDVHGGNPAAAAALARRGWEIQPADVLVSDDPLSALSRPEAIAIIATGTATVANQRLVQPLLNHGAMAQVLLLSGTTVIGQRLLPIDATLPSDARIWAELPRTAPTVVIDHRATPAVSCEACHASAQHIWATSAHARALSSLSIADQGTDCAICHTTAIPGRSARAPQVTCSACHPGAEAHAAAPATAPPPVGDCRACHDAQHHPAFDPVAAWLRIEHRR